MKKILFFLSIVMFIAISSCKKEDTATCNDGILNGDEVGIDCGGNCEDCPSCFDGILNGDEEGRDCGGSCFQPCNANPFTFDPNNPYNLNATLEISGENHEMIGSDSGYTYNNASCGPSSTCYLTTVDFYIEEEEEVISALEIRFLFPPTQNIGLIEEGTIPFLTQEELELPSAIEIKMSFNGSQYISSNTDNTNNTFTVAEYDYIGFDFAILEGNFSANLKNSEGEEITIDNCEYRGAVLLSW